MSTACTRPMNGPRVSALWVALFVMCQYSLIAHAQNGRSSAGSSPTLEEGNGSEVPGGFMPKWRRAGEDHGLKFSLQDTYDFQGNPTGGRTQMGTFFGRWNGTLRLDEGTTLKLSRSIRSRPNRIASMASASISHPLPQWTSEWSPQPALLDARRRVPEQPWGKTREVRWLRDDSVLLLHCRLHSR